jgi:hypothetical protein
MPRPVPVVWGSVSTYASYRDSRFWGNAIASTGGLFFDTNRQVLIGIITQPNTSSTRGSNFSLMLEANFTTPTSFASVLQALRLFGERPNG